MIEVDRAADAIARGVAQRCAACADPAAAEAARLEGVAAAMGLLASLLAEDDEQLTATAKLLADLDANDVPAERAIGSLALLLTRHAVGSNPEAARAVAQSWQAAGGAGLAAAARMIMLTTAWLDRDGLAARALNRCERLIEADGEPGAALAAALAALSALLGLPAEAGCDQPLDEALRLALAAARAVATVG